MKWEEAQAALNRLLNKKGPYSKADYKRMDELYAIMFQAYRQATN